MDALETQESGNYQWFGNKRRYEKISMENVVIQGETLK